MRLTVRQWVESLTEAELGFPLDREFWISWIEDIMRDPPEGAMRCPAACSYMDAAGIIYPQL